MKIDYAIVSSNSNSTYLDFWPIVSKLWKEKIGIEPILIYIDENQDVKLSEEYGKVFRWKYIKNIPISIQVLWIRCWFPTMFPNKVSIISDIDMLPLSKHYFVDQIKNVSKNKYIHINPCMETYGRIPSCYHIALGRNFKKVLNLPERWEDALTMLHKDFKNPQKELTQTYWFLDEDYPSSVIPKYKESNPLDVLYIPRTGGQNGRRIDRSGWKFDLEKVKSDYYYDSHSARPYEKYKKDIDSICKAALNEKTIENSITCEKWNKNGKGCALIKKKAIPNPETMRDSYPVITGMGFRKNSDFIYDEFQKKDFSNSIKEDGKIIFIKTDHIPSFFDRVLPKINHKVNIITHNSAHKISNGHKKYLDNDKIINWYAQNAGKCGSCRSCWNPKIKNISYGKH